jgi:tetrahydromethanopterin S-methyltransferase subunit A
MIAIENANIDAYWKKHMKTLLENVDVQFLDRNGMALKCSKLEVDELRVQVNDIDSTDDKIFLLEKVHKNLGIIDNALMMLKMPDKKHKVRQSESELKNLRSELELIREKIFKAPVGPTRYGLFVKYPEGYEG